MDLNVKRTTSLKFGKNIFPGQVGFVHRTGSDQNGWDKFMTAGITLLGSSLFTSFAPNHIFIVVGEIDGKIMCLEASGHEGQVVLRDFAEYYDSNDLIIRRDLKDELKMKVKFSPEKIKEYIELKFDDSCILGLGLYQILAIILKMLGMKNLAKKVRRWYVPRVGSGIHCSNFIFRVLEEMAEISSFDRSLSEINHDHISPWDLWLSSIFEPHSLSSVFQKETVSDKRHKIVSSHEEISRLNANPHIQPTVEQGVNFLKVLHSGGKIANCF